MEEYIQRTRQIGLLETKPRGTRTRSGTNERVPQRVSTTRPQKRDAVASDNLDLAEWPMELPLAPWA